MAYQQSSVKRAQKEKLILHEFSKMLLQLTLDDPRLQGMYISHVKLSPNKSACTIFFHVDGGLEAFKEKLKTLVLYKPSLRTAIGKTIPSRYVPELIFKFDTHFEKQQRVESLLHKIHESEDDDEDSES